MPTLIATSYPDRGFRCGVKGWLNSEEEKRQWREITTALLGLALYERRLVLVTLSPQAWSVGHALPLPRILDSGGETYLLNSVAASTRPVLARYCKEIAVSEDFARGLLWILPEFAHADDSAVLTATKVDWNRSLHPASEVEFVGMQDDGHSLYWLRPSRPVELICETVRSAAEGLAWKVAAHS